MRFLHSRYLSLALVALLVLTSQAMAVARGAPGAAGVIELCTGTGPVMVAVDESGAPVGPPHLCPEQALSLLNCLFVVETGTEPQEGVGRTMYLAGASQRGADLSPRRVARAPPGRV